ncbi:acyl transferase [Adhaeribacter radiodurans]|uniref:Acyl transferase n=1 Tax=Adhaeribacter radiodurans TaxID=2745197 RepID=A0A7L7L8Q7_9BACT|nr:acyl transferase [Adhaeribacter radiodurans]QMU29201.1 acyl transferase [Adhaeribacter radiodurans]
MDFKQNFKYQLHSQIPTRKTDFEERAFALFQYQVRHNAVYQAYVTGLKIKPESVKSLTQIPFLPIEFFKTQTVQTDTFKPETIFLSSGTTQAERSRHLLLNLAFYLDNTKLLFESQYGKLTDYVFLALLPSYIEQGNSSLVAMVDYFMQKSGQTEPGFFLHDQNALLKSLRQAKQSGKKVILFGVTYALLDLADFVQENNQTSLFQDVILMETGGMKGRRREMIRSELHALLQQAYGLNSIHSEYGMTELLSQAYSKGQGVFQCPPTMQIVLRDPNDPLDRNPTLQTGGINIIDLANVDSCAFIETKDLGKLYPDGSFEVLGRFDNSDIRGCNLMVS